MPVLTSDFYFWYSSTSFCLSSVFFFKSMSL